MEQKRNWRKADGSPFSAIEWSSRASCDQPPDQKCPYDRRGFTINYRRLSSIIGVRRV